MSPKLVVALATPLIVALGCGGTMAFTPRLTRAGDTQSAPHSLNAATTVEAELPTVDAPSPTPAGAPTPTPPTPLSPPSAPAGRAASPLAVATTAPTTRAAATVTYNVQPSVLGHAALDAHDGMILLAGGTFYLYGTSYACGFEWQHDSPFCGFHVWQSTDLVNWSNPHLMFDPTAYQVRCNGRYNGCFDVRVVYNATTAKYVAWFSQPANAADHYDPFAVLEADSPAGPFVEVSGGCDPVRPVCTTGTRGNWPGAGSWSEADLVVDASGAGWVVTDDHYPPPQTSSSTISRLSADFTTTVGQPLVIMHPDNREGHAVFQRAGTYYMLLGQDCSYCLGSGLEYFTAPEMGGPWTARGPIDVTGCRMQETSVLAIPMSAGPGFLHQADIWLSTPNEAGADQAWRWLRFDSNGVILPFNCLGEGATSATGTVGPVVSVSPSPAPSSSPKAG